MIIPDWDVMNGRDVDAVIIFEEQPEVVIEQFSSLLRREHLDLAIKRRRCRRRRRRRC